MTINQVLFIIIGTVYLISIIPALFFMRVLKNSNEDVDAQGNKLTTTMLFLSVWLATPMFIIWYIIKGRNK